MGKKQNIFTKHTKLVLALLICIACIINTNSTARANIKPMSIGDFSDWIDVLAFQTDLTDGNDILSAGATANEDIVVTKVEHGTDTYLYFYVC
jgi:hypothetical protein